MNSESNSQNNINPAEAIEVDEMASLDDFIRELEAQEKSLQISPEQPVVTLTESEAQENDLAEIEKFLESYESSAPDVSPALTPTPATTATTASEPSMVLTLGNKVSELERELSKAEKARTETIESFKRRQNDFDNFKKRIEREKSETRRNILSSLAMQMLPVVDNLNRALDSTAGQESAKSADFQQFIQGIVLVNHQLNDALAEIGVRPILALGQPFDPHFHEAVATEPSDELPPNTVIAELLRGYQLEEKIIRPAMVKVSAAAAGREASIPTDADASNLLELE